MVKVLDELFWRLAMRENDRDANPYLKEIRVATIVHHPAFPHVLRAGTIPDGRPFIVLEYVPGPTLAEALKRDGPLQGERAARVVAEMCSALHTLHAHNVIYRDLKPEHVLLQPEGSGDFRTRILDLGHAQTTYQSDNRSRHEKGQPVGSPGYMSPELARGRPGTERSDVFSLALVAYELLAGIPAIHIEDARPENLVEYVLSNAPIPVHPLHAIRPDLPAELDTALARAFDRRPRRRPGTVRKLGDALLPLIVRDAGPIQSTVGSVWSWLRGTLGK